MKRVKFIAFSVMTTICEKLDKKELKACAVEVGYLLVALFYMFLTTGDDDLEVERIIFASSLPSNKQALRFLSPVLVLHERIKKK